MTVPLSRSAKCEHCGHGNEIELYETINSHDRHLREKLTSGELWTWRCEACGKHALSIYPLLYHDMRAWCLIYYLDRRITEDPRVIERMVPAADQLTALRRFNVNYRFRLCRSLEDFIEKVRILDAGLDDRAVEYLKLRNRALGGGAPLATNGARRMMVRIASEGRFQRLTGGEPKCLEFGLSTLPSTDSERSLRTEIAFSTYTDALAQIDGRLGKQPDIGSGFIIVDQPYIEEQFAAAAPKREAAATEASGNMGAIVYGNQRRENEGKSWWRFW